MEAQQSVFIHPLVLLNVADHYKRSGENYKKRVVGTLLGEKTKTTIEVTNSFAVPFEEDRKDSNIWVLDHNHHTKMYDMFKKVNAKEKVVGWYSTGSKIKSSDNEITELYKKFTKTPIFVIINVSSYGSSSINIQAYSLVTSKEYTGKIFKRFINLITIIKSNLSEEIGVEQLLRDVKNKMVNPLSKIIEDKYKSLFKLTNSLNKISEYLRNVYEKKLPVNKEIIFLIEEIVNNFDNLDINDELERCESNENNETVMLYFISKIIKSITAIDNLTNNKCEIQESLLISKVNEEKNSEKRIEN